MADVQTYISHLQISIPESIYDTEEKEKKKKNTSKQKHIIFFIIFPTLLSGYLQMTPS